MPLRSRRTLALAVVITASLAQLGTASMAQSRPNIVFILADDLGYGDVSISPLVNRTNVIPTPNVERLAANGMKFLRGYSGQVCAPSRCSLMTGLHSGHCTVRGNDGSYTPLRSNDTTVAQVLRKYYKTALFGKWGLGDFGTTGYPLEQGFDVFVGQDSQVACHEWYPNLIQNNTDGSCKVPNNDGASASTCGPARSNCTWSNDLFADQAVKFIRDNAKGSQPFFVYFSTTTPHVGNLKDSGTSWPTPAPYVERFPQWSAEAAQHDFATAVSAQDDFVGRVLDTLEATGIENNTIVFFSGDNGPDDHHFSFFDDPGPFRGKKRSLHEGGIRQTMAVQWKGHIAPNSTTRDIFAFWDFLPTAADLAGVPSSELPRQLDGISIKETLINSTAGPKQASRPYLYYEYCYYANLSGLLPQLYEPGWAQAVRFDDTDGTEWKAIRSNRGTLLLFNLTADMSESFNVTAQFPAIANRAIKMMEEAHVEDPFWKSSNNASDKCCAACYNHHGCASPCRHINAQPDDKDAISTLKSPSGRVYVDRPQHRDWTAPTCRRKPTAFIDLALLQGRWHMEGEAFSCRMGDYASGTTRRQLLCEGDQTPLRFTISDHPSSEQEATLADRVQRLVVAYFGLPGAGMKIVELCELDASAGSSLALTDEGGRPVLLKETFDFD